ncbi:MAG TPA: amidohydrolase [Gemmataceae bacterium]|nr:amidohydrolase [Gemmataceae bacterium]
MIMQRAWSYPVIRLTLLIASLLLPKIAAATDPKLQPSEGLKERMRDVTGQIEKNSADLETLYKYFHSHPELSLVEEHTSARLAQEIKGLGFDVTTKVGGYGVVAILKNGPGPTVLVRTDMDALPVVEQTSLPYASKVRTRDRNGNDVGAMHACGHDMHMTCWIGTARTLASLKDKWQGTLMFIAQPAEEIGTGARLMIADGLFKRFPKPDYCLALHCDARSAHGSITYTDGLALANVDSVDIVVHGKGGHGAAPHTTIDPVVIAARIILDLQTIVSRETNPTDPAVVTVGSIHGGTKHNIIPAEVKMQLTVRTTKDSVRKHTLEAIERIAKAAAQAAGAPEPTVTSDPGEFTPALMNDSKLTRRTVAVFKEALGAENVHERPPIMGGEDFSRYGREGVPIFLYFLGTLPRERVAESERTGQPLPSLHSDRYYPTPEPSIKTGVLTMSLAVLNLVGK